MARNLRSTASEVVRYGLGLLGVDFGGQPTICTGLIQQPDSVGFTKGIQDADRFRGRKRSRIGRLHYLLVGWALGQLLPVCYVFSASGLTDEAEHNGVTDLGVEGQRVDNIERSRSPRKSTGVGCLLLDVGVLLAAAENIGTEASIAYQGGVDAARISPVDPMV